MATHNPHNERIKRQYLTYLKEAKRQSEAFEAAGPRTNGAGQDACAKIGTSVRIENPRR